MNEKNTLINEYIDLKEKNLENNFGEKCNLNEKNRTNEYELVDGDDEQTDEQTDEDQSKLNKVDGQKRRRKSSGRQNTQSSHALHSSSSSLSSWTNLSESTIMNQTIINNQILNSKKNGNGLNLNSSYDTISEEEHRAKQIRQKLKTIDDDNIVSSSCDDDNDKLEMNKSTLETNNSTKSSSSKTKQQHSSADSLSSSPTQQEHIKSSSTNQNQNQMNNKTDQLNQIQQQRKLINHLEQQHCCFNHHHTNNNNYYYLNNHQTEPIPWLYNNIQREEADLLLNKFINIDGVFLVRISTKNLKDSYAVLSFVHDCHIKHCHIKKMNVDKTICFSLDEGKTKFYDIKQLIEFYQLNQYFLPTRLRYFLVHK